MVSPEFNSAIKTGNLLRVRIMLKDSLIVDPTFAQFNEMLAYARQGLPELLEPYDNGSLEDDRSKWDKDLMNMELVEIVNNFSQTRIDHLKRVISIVLADKIRSAKMVTPHQPGQQSHQPSGRGSYNVQVNTNARTPSPADVEAQKVAARKKALSQLTNSSKKIESIMRTIRNKDENVSYWSPSEINEAEKAAREILDAIRIHKNNR